MFTETTIDATMANMPRTPTIDRSNVTAEDSPVIAMRLTPREATVLDTLVRMQNEQAEDMGIAAAVTRASAMRALLRQAAKAKGLWDASDSHPSTVEPQADPEADFATVLDAIRADAKRVNLGGLADIPSVVRALSRSMPAARVHAAIKAGVERRVLELSQNASPDLFSKADTALCMPGLRGTTMSMVRELVAETPELEASKVAARIEKALTAGRFESAAKLASAAGITPNDVSRIRRGHGLVQDKLTKLDAALAARKV